MNLQEQHWTKLFGRLTPEGTSRYGIWTVSSPEKEIIKQFKGIRNFRANEDKTVITHTNQYFSPDGSEEEKQWQIEKEACNLPDGLVHPAAPSNRGLALSDRGATAWVTKTLQPERPFGIEFFFRQEDDSNNSLGIIYGESGSLDRILHIRERLGSFPEPAAEPAIENLSGKWVGKKETMTPDLQVSPAEDTQELVLEPTGGKNETSFLTEGIVLNYPAKLPVGEEFELAAGKLVSESEFKRLTAKYDSSGAFALLISEVFHRQE
ncbi:MAG: DUF3598 family protein [Oscillatoria princeps RMCB-10]|jgi:hypothetical protein|nr:DUF3598 family protein [Oscillatoria princeps RMCB-10]